MTDEEEEGSPGRAQYEILREYEIWAGSPEERKGVAVWLDKWGCTPERLRLICENVEGRGGDSAKTAGAIAAILKDWRPFVEDLEYAAAQRTARPQSHGRKREQPPTNLPELGAAERRASEADAYVRERMAEEVAKGDEGRGADWMAEHMGVGWTEARVREACGG